MNKKIKKFLVFACLLMLTFLLTGCDVGWIEKTSYFDSGDAISNIFAELTMKFTVLPADITHDMMETVIDTSYIDDITLVAKTSQHDSVVIGDGNKTIKLDKVWGYVNQLYGWVKPVGIALCITWFLISIFGLASRDNTTLEHYVRELIKMLIAVTIIDKLPTLMNYLMSIGDTLVNKVGNYNFVAEGTTIPTAWQILMGDSLSDISIYKDNGTKFVLASVMDLETPTLIGLASFFSSTVDETAYNEMLGDANTVINTLRNYNVDNVCQALTTYSFPGTFQLNHPDMLNGEKIKEIMLFARAIAGGKGLAGSLNWYGAFGFTAILWFMSIVTKIASYFVIYQRLLDILWRVVFAPIGCSNFFDGQGANTPGVRYLKSFFASCLTGAVLIVILKIGNVISMQMLGQCSNVSENVKNILLTVIALRLAMIGTAIGVSNKVKEVLS